MRAVHRSQAHQKNVQTNAISFGETLSDAEIRLVSGGGRSINELLKLDANDIFKRLVTSSCGQVIC